MCVLERVFMMMKRRRKRKRTVKKMRAARTMRKKKMKPETQRKSVRFVVVGNCMERNPPSLP
jgi:UDP-2,3-diacylglucosamine pyrophosphatase LpxH